jgi:GAF domain-containing protein
MHVVATGQPLLIEDARLHPVLSENLAVDQLGVVAYAGVPLFASEGEAIGTYHERPSRRGTRFSPSPRMSCAPR